MPDTVMEKTEGRLSPVEFIAEYASHLMGCGIHTSRIIRNTKRIGRALGFDIRITVFQKSMVLSIMSADTGEIVSEVVENPALPISFEHNSELSALSWEAVDNHLSFAQIQDRYRKIIASPRLDFWHLLLLVGAANASFCRLFGGDWYAMSFVFVATIAGFYVKTVLQEIHLNHFLVFITSAFTASIISSLSLFFDITSDIALATSVLFLIPGVPLINGVIDIIEGHTLTGISRLTSALLLVICIAIGLSVTLILVHNRLL